MVSAVTGSTYNSYLSQLVGNSTSSSATTANAGATSDASSAASATSSAQSLVSSLLSGGSYSSSVLSLLQENSSGSFDPITTLLGGSGTSDALTGLYDNLYASAAAASLTQAQADSTEIAGGASSSGPGASTASAPSAQSLIAQQTQASIAYNTTNQQNAQAVLSANSYGANGSKLTG